MKNTPVILLLAFLLASCAFGRKVPYENMKVNLNFSGSSAVAVTVLDQREMISDHSQKSDFTGYTRSGVGIAFPMGTESGKAFADVLRETITDALSVKGFTVMSAADRQLLVKIKRMHSDFYSFTMFYYDVDVSVLDKTGNALVTANFHKEDRISGNGIGQGKYKEYSPAYLAGEIQSWLNDPHIAGALR